MALFSWPIRALLNSGAYGAAIIDNGVPAFGTQQAQNLTGVISGHGRLGRERPPGAAGVLTLSAANSFTGNITITNGTVVDTRVNENVAAPTVSGLGNPRTANRFVTVGTGGTLTLSASSGGNEFGNGGSAPLLSDLS